MQDFYYNFMKQNHTDFVVSDFGFNILQGKPFSSESPDNMVACDSCGEGTLEIKGPFCHRNDTIELAASSGKSFCIKKLNDVYMLKKSHQYYKSVYVGKITGILLFGHWKVHLFKESCQTQTFLTQLLRKLRNSSTYALCLS